jgi:hypothetical protein
MVPSKRKLARLAESEERREKRGFTQDVIAKVQKDARPSFPPISPRRQALIDMVKATFDSMAEKMGGVNINSRKCKNWEEATATETGEWTGAVTKMVFMYYLGTHKGRPHRLTQDGIDVILRKKNVRVHSNTLEGFRISLCQAVRRSREGQALPKSLQRDMINQCRDLGSKLGIRTKPTKRAELATFSLAAIVTGLTSLDISPRRRLSCYLYLALASNTGLRAGSILRTDKADSGAVYGDFLIWIVPGSDTVNDVVAYYTPRHGKTERVTATRFPLGSAPQLGMSANMLLLLAAFLDGVISDLDIKSVLQPRFLGKDGSPRRLIFESDE